MKREAILTPAQMASSLRNRANYFQSAEGGWRDDSAALLNEAADTMDTLASELERVRKENAWQDIASAPRDGTYILAWRALLDVPLVVTWERPAQTPPMMRLVSTERHDHEGFWRQPMSAKPTPYQPTHWQPLPLPPQAKGG